MKYNNKIDQTNLTLTMSDMEALKTQETLCH